MLFSRLLDFVFANLADTLEHLEVLQATLSLVNVSKEVFNYVCLFESL